LNARPLQGVFDLHRAVHQFGLAIDHLPRARLTQAEAFVLAYLHPKGSATIAQLHRAFGHRRSTLTAVVDRLERRGLVARRSSPRDRRLVVVSVTRAGAASAKRVHQRLVRVEKAALRGVPEADIVAFQRVLQRLGGAADNI
jgi:DNA-binding MarR family transcriptional regulator